MKDNNYKLTEYKKEELIKGIILGLFLVLVLSVIVIIKSNSFYYSKEKNTNLEELTINDNIDNKYRTIIVHDNTYSGVSIKNYNDAKKLIEKDSIKQKKTCNSKIVNLESTIIKEFGITAVNLCEMDYDFAYELYKVLNKIYSEYPNIKGYMTNISLRNYNIKNEKIIAAFTPTFEFARSNTSNTYPWVYKTEILLNSNYFLNKSKLITTVNDAGATGHFPPNVTTYSPVAHEFGHYLSFIALLNNYKTNSILLINKTDNEKLYKITYDYSKGVFSKKILKKAYNNYLEDTNNKNIDFNSWRRTISSYAVSKDTNGEYIYDETIAEAFHDVYLNGENAQDASKYIIEELKNNLKG